MNPTDKKERLCEFQAALIKLKESEIELAKVTTKYAELESIFQKQNSVINNLTASSSKTECNCRENLLTNISSKRTNKPEKPSATSSKIEIGSKRNSSDKAKRHGENLLASKKSSGSVNVKGGNSQLQKRICQCHESVNNINMLSQELGGKKKFLNHLQKLNYELWNSRKLKDPVVAKLEMQMGDT